MMNVVAFNGVSEMGAIITFPLRSEFTPIDVASWKLTPVKKKKTESNIKLFLKGDLQS